MTPGAVIKVLPGFKGDAVVIKQGDQRGVHASYGCIRGGVIDAGRMPLVGLRVEYACRLQIADIEIRDALQKGIHMAEGWYEVNVANVRINVDLKTRNAPGSVGLHYGEKCGDSLVSSVVVIGYETGVRSDSFSNDFQLVHVWNCDDTQGPMLHCFYCNGWGDSYSQCYADSPTIAGFYVSKPCQRIIANRVYYSRWAADDAGAGILITPGATHGLYLGNYFTADEKHRLARAIDGDLNSATILGNSFSPSVRGGRAAQVPSRGGGASAMPPLDVAGPTLRLTQPLACPPAPDSGSVGDIAWGESKGESYLMLRTASGWKKARLE